MNNLRRAQYRQGDLLRVKSTGKIVLVLPLVNTCHGINRGGMNPFLGKDQQWILSVDDQAKKDDFFYFVLYINAPVRHTNCIIETDLERSGNPQ